jgi:OmpA-OmpF porin, OOP family
MLLRSRAFILSLVFLGLAGLPVEAEAQFGRRIRQAAERAAERETVRQVDRKVTEVVRCALTDQACIDKAKQEGKEVEAVDEHGNVVAAGSTTSAPRPGEGAWANYDFIPGEDILFAEDYSRDQVGDFPRRMELSQGNWEVIEWEGERFLRATSNGIIAIPLPQTLPERFTIEMPVNITHGNARIYVMPGRAYNGPARNYRGSVATMQMTRAGVSPVGGSGTTALSQYGADKVRDKLISFRIMADGRHMKVYLDEQRVANVPNADYPRSDTLFIAVSSASASHPILIGTVRVAGGGRELYDALARDGRVALQGIFFDTGSDRLRAESTPTLREITSMLQKHADLRIRIEGHTDNVGAAAANQALSERRAAAVRAYLVEQGIDALRLQSQGFGEGRPAGSNDTPEGRQQNRRVELVRLQ